MSAWDPIVHWSEARNVRKASWLVLDQDQNTGNRKESVRVVQPVRRSYGMVRHFKLHNLIEKN